MALVHILLHIFENEIENVPCRFFRSMNHAVLCQGVIQLDEYLIDERQDGGYLPSNLCIPFWDTDVSL